MKLVIGNKNYSSWSLRPWLLLTHYELPFEEIRIPLDQSSTKAELAKYSDSSRVPALHDGDLQVWDSLAIGEYVSEKYLQGRGWPKELKARVEARSCSAEMHSGFSELRNNLPMNCRAVGRKVPLSAGIEQDIERIDRIWSRMRSRYAAQGPWLFGDFSIADCMFAPVAFRFRTYGIILAQSGSQEFMQTLLQHPGMQLWLQQATAETEVIEYSELGR